MAEFEFSKYGDWSKKLGIDLVPAKIISANSINELKSKLKKEKGIVLLSSANYKTNRYAVEHSLVRSLIDIETHKKSDKTHYRRGGLDSILCKFMKKNNVSYVVNFLSFAKSKNKALIFGRMLQNARLCRKYKTKVTVTSGALRGEELKSESILKAFAQVLKIKS